MKRCSRHFTLVELLVVVSIIIVLLGMLLPSVHRARKYSQSAACKNNLHGVAIAFQMYWQENNDLMPLAAQMPSLGLNGYPRIADVLSDKISSANLLCCPGDKGQAYFSIFSSDSDYADLNLTNSNSRIYFKTEGSSYEYNSMLGINNQRLKDSRFVQHVGESKVPMMFDYTSFHGIPGKLGASNFLFADCHVGDIE